MKKLYYKKILLTYSAVLFCLTVLFSSVYFMKVSEGEKRGFEEQNQVLFADYVANQEQIIKSLIKTCDQIANLPTLGTFAISSNNDYYGRMSDLFSDLRKIGGVGVRPVYMVQKQGDETVLTNLQSSPLKLQLKSFGIREEDYEQVVTSFEKSDRNNVQLLFSDSGVLYITSKTFGNYRVILSGFSHHGETVKRYGEDSYASFSLQSEEITDLRAKKNPDEENPALKAINERLRETTILESEGSIFYCLHSQYSNLLYYMKTAPFGIDVLSAVLQFLPFLLVTFALAFLVILYLSKWMYAPIDNLVSILTDMQDGSNGGQGISSDIEYLAKQVSKIRYENQHLTKAIEDNRISSKNRFLTALLSGNYDRETLQGELSRYSLDWLSEPCFLVFADLLGGEELTEEFLPIIMERLAAVFKTEMATVRESGSYFVVRTEDSERLSGLLAEIVSILETAFHIEIVFYIGKQTKSPENLNYSLLTIEQVYENSLSCSRKSVYHFEDMGNTSRHASIYPIAIEQKLLQAVETGSKSDLHHLLHYIKEEYLAREFDRIAVRKTLIYAFINTINRCCERFSVDMEKVFEAEYNPYLELSTAASPQIFLELVEQILGRIAQLAGTNRQQQEHDLKPKIEQYIADNLQRDISLITMADHFQLSPNYMSAIFKNIIGENFKDYTSRCRFELSVRYLCANPQLTLQELAQMVGINSTVTLIRLFKKYADCSPSQYLQRQNK